MNELFEEEYGMSLEEAYESILNGELTIDDVIESDEFFEFLTTEKNMLWTDLEEKINK